jgi:hypothetical protein
VSATRTTLDSLLKDFYLGPVQEQLNNEMLVLQMYEKMSVDWSGRQTIIPIHTGRTTSVGFAAESTGAGAGGVLPAAVNQTYNNLTVTAVYLYGTFRISGPAVASAKNGGKGAFIGWMEAEMDKLVTDVKNQADYQMVNGGDILGFITSSVNNATQLFTGDYGSIAPADTVDIHIGWGPGFDSAGNPVNTTYLARSILGATIAAGGVNETAGTLTFTGAQDTTVAELNMAASGQPAVVRARSGLAAAQAEPVGIMTNLFGGSTATTADGVMEHFGVVRSGAARAVALDSVAMCAQETPTAAGLADLTVERLQRVLDEISVLSGEEPNVLICHPSIRSNYVSLLTGTGLYATSRGSATKGDGGFLDLSFGNIPIKFSRHCPRGMVIFMNTKTWKLLQLQSGGFADLDGTTVLRASGADAWEGFYRWYYNTVCVRPNANGVLVGVNVWT